MDLRLNRRLRWYMFLEFDMGLRSDKFLRLNKRLKTDMDMRLNRRWRLDMFVELDMELRSDKFLGVKHVLAVEHLAEFGHIFGVRHVAEVSLAT